MLGLWSVVALGLLVASGSVVASLPSQKLQEQLVQGQLELELAFPVKVELLDAYSSGVCPSCPHCRFSTAC